MREYIEIRDFSAGLVSSAGFLVPPNGAQSMQDCYPLPQGGLRAWFATTSVALTDVGASEIPVATFVSTGLGATPSEGADYFLLTWLASDKKMRLYRMDTSAGATAWTTLKTFTAGSTGFPGHCNFTLYRLAAGTLHLYVAHNNSGSSEAGVWRIALATGTMTAIAVTGNFERNLIVFQDRLMCATDEGGSCRIRYTDVATETFGASNFIDIGPSDGDGVAWFFPYSPTDLLIGKESAFYMLQGEITDPEVRRQSTSLNVGVSQGLVEIEQGLAVQAVNQGYFVTQNGVSLDPLSPQLKDSDVTGIFASHESLGFPVYLNKFLVTPFGKVWSRDTNSWFSISDWSTSVPAISAYWRHRINWKGFFVKYDKSAAFTIRPQESTTRKQTYTWKSAPLRSNDGRQIVVREVQVYLENFVAGASVVITVNGTARTVSSIGTGRQKITTQFRESAEELDVQVVPNSNSASFEAPIIEVIRIGTITGRRTDLR